MAINAADQTSMVAQCIAFLLSTQTTGVRILTSAKLFYIIFIITKLLFVLMYDVIAHLILHFCTLFSF